MLLSVGVQTAFAERRVMEKERLQSRSAVFVHEDFDKGETAWMPMISAVVLRGTAPCIEVLLTRDL